MMTSDDGKAPRDLLGWLGLTDAPNWRVARPLGALVSVALALLFFFALLAAFVVVFRAAFGETEASLGVGALIAALLGAPFLIWSTVIRHQTLRYQKEGHMTDRIAKAVEMLGAEKTVKKTINGQSVEVTEPNLEVRIGAILSLERIAQDSTRYDKGRDHVRVMEILCAYVRNNAPAATAQDHPFGEWEPLKKDATEEERAEHERNATERFGTGAYPNGKVRQWALSLPEPKTDIALVLVVLGRRSREQMLVEAAWPDPPNAKTKWPFECDLPPTPDDTISATPSSLREHCEKRDTYSTAVLKYSGYRIDLRDCNLQGAQMGNGRFSGAVFRGSRMDGATLSRANMEGANLDGASLNGATLFEARLTSADLEGSQMEGARLYRTRLEEANLEHAKLDGATLRFASMDGASFWRASLERTDLSKASMVEVSLGNANMSMADLRGARLEGATLQETSADGADFRQATMHWAKATGTDFSNVNLSATQIETMFGDGSVKLLVQPPRHWPRARLYSTVFLEQYDLWLADPEGYRPPPP